jgi:hypothetical protein
MTKDDTINYTQNAMVQALNNLALIMMTTTFIQITHNNINKGNEIVIPN